MLFYYTLIKGVKHVNLYTLIKGVKHVNLYTLSCELACQSVHL